MQCIPFAPEHVPSSNGTGTAVPSRFHKATYTGSSLIPTTMLGLLNSDDVSAYIDR